MIQSMKPQAEPNHYFNKSYDLKPVLLVIGIKFTKLYIKESINYYKDIF